MYIKYIEKLKDLYNEDVKNLRNGSILFGHLFEGRWQTHCYKPLSSEAIQDFENEIGELPLQYKELLQVSNGIYLFDLLQIAGKTKKSLKGLSDEEQNHEPTSLENIVPYLGRKKMPVDVFPFAASMVNNSFFVFYKDGQVQELNSKNLKVINSFDKLESLLDKVFEEGIEMVHKGEYIDFH